MSIAEIDTLCLHNDYSAKVNILHQSYIDIVYPIDNVKNIVYTVWL